MARKKESQAVKHTETGPSERDPNYVPRLKKMYAEEIVPKLKKVFTGEIKVKTPKPVKQTEPA